MTHDHEQAVAGNASYLRWKSKLTASPEKRRIYDEEAAKSELWLQLVEARQAAGLTQAQLADRLGVTQSQIAKIEQRGYEAHTLTTLRRYVEAIGGYRLSVRIEPIDSVPLSV